jgi:predicted nucleic acid-binding Zn ribbon protein
MPTYVYKFIDTGETIEVQQSFSDHALTEALHPASGIIKPVKKVFLPVGVAFKGGGFYKTDSRNGSKSTSSTSSGSSASSSASTSGSDSSASGTGGSDSGSSPAPAPAAPAAAPAKVAAGD